MPLRRQYKLSTTLHFDKQLPNLAHTKCGELFEQGWLSLVDSYRNCHYTTYSSLEELNYGKKRTSKWLCKPEGRLGLSGIIPACYSASPFLYTSQIHCA